MARENINDLIAFLAVARERSFTRAAAQLGVSQSRLSHTVRGLEERLGVRLLTRTTRSVAPTQAGERLLRSAWPQAGRNRGRARGIERVPREACRHVQDHGGRPSLRDVLWPRLANVSCAITPISNSRSPSIRPDEYRRAAFDAGVRLGEQVAKDMIAVRIGPDVRFAVIGSPSYFASRPR